MVALKAGGDALRERGVGQEVAGHLFEDELVEGHVACEGIDHPVAPAPHDAFAIGLVAVGVGITGGIEPAGGHAFGEAGGGEEAVDGGLVGSVAVEFSGSWWEAGEVEAEAAEQCFFLRWRRWLESKSCELGFDEVVNASACFASGGEIGPVRLPGRAGLSPTAQGCDFAGAERVADVGRWHASRLVVGCDAIGDEAAGRLRRSLLIKTEADALGGGVGAVATPALVREDGAHVAVEFNGLRGECSG